jgi:3-phenylpropionate/cinnamic acid dioxygenase small subunit
VEAIDIIEVHQLLGQYGHLVDAKQWDRFDELFEPDAELDYTGVRAPAVLHGLAAIQDWFREVNHPSAHHVVNIVVYEEEDQVRVRSKFFAPYTRPTHEPKRWYGGDYDDVVVRTPAGWRFAKRTCSARWLFTPDGPDADSVPEHRRTW